MHILFFRKSVLEYGMFHQIKVDDGREFFLRLGIHKQLGRSLKKQPRIITLQTNRVKKGKHYFICYLFASHVTLQPGAQRSLCLYKLLDLLPVSIGFEFDWLFLYQPKIRIMATFGHI